MIKNGFKQSKFDECFYFKKVFEGSKYNKLLVTMHVDDCEVCGDPRELKRFKQSLERGFGSVKEQSWNFRHCGIEYKQSKDLTRLQHSQCEFINAMKFYPMGKERGRQVASPLTAQEATGFRSVLGGLQWASHTRADHVAECSRLQGNCPRHEGRKRAP